MKNKQKDNQDVKAKMNSGDLQEPHVDYGAVNKTIQVFHSFESAANYEIRKNSERTYDERLLQLEELRKLVYSQYLQADGNWPPLQKCITITKS